MKNNGREVAIGKLKKLAIDIKNGTSYSVDYLLSPEVNETLSKKGIKIRKAFSPLLRLIYGFKTDYKLVIDSREEIKENDKGTIFVVNHRQSDDIVLGAKAIAESGYFVFGNKYLSLDTQNGLGLWAYGMMPNMSGTDMMKNLKGNGYNKPIVVLTANAMAGEEEKYLKEGFDDYLGKPIKKQEFENVIKKYLV